MAFHDLDWTYCKDELPEREDDYLVLWRKVGSNNVFYEIQEFCMNEWQINIPQAHGDAVEIIAWLDLPDIPKEAYI